MSGKTIYELSNKCRWTGIGMNDCLPQTVLGAVFGLRHPSSGMRPYSLESAPVFVITPPRLGSVSATTSCFGG